MMIIMDNGYGDKRNFEVVDKIPDGSQIWNIGRSNFTFDKMIPLCECSKDYRVNIETLKAFKCKSEDIALKLLKEAGYKKVTKKRILELNGAE